MDTYHIVMDKHTNVLSVLPTEECSERYLVLVQWYTTPLRASADCALLTSFLKEDNILAYSGLLLTLNGYPVEMGVTIG